MLVTMLLLGGLDTASAAKCRRVTVIVDGGNCPKGFENTVGAACANRCADIPKYTPEGTGCRYDQHPKGPFAEVSSCWRALHAHGCMRFKHSMPVMLQRLSCMHSAAGRDRALCAVCVLRQPQLTACCFATAAHAGIAPHHVVWASVHPVTPSAPLSWQRQSSALVSPQLARMTAQTHATATGQMARRSVK